MKEKLVISLDQTIGIREFMSEYLGIDYKKPHKLSHQMMDMYLLEKGYGLPRKVNYQEVDQQGLLMGEYLAVRSETTRKKKGTIQIYENPKKLYHQSLLRQLKKEANEYRLRKVRQNILNSLGLALLEQDEIISLDDFNRQNLEESYDISEKVNRQKVYGISSGRHLKNRSRWK